MKPPEKLLSLILFVAKLIGQKPQCVKPKILAVRSKVGPIEPLRKKLKTPFFKGFSAIVVKRFLVQMYVHLIGNPDALAELTGIDESWSRRYIGDRTLRHSVPFFYIPFLLCFLDERLELSFEGPLKQVAIVAGITNAAPKLGHAMNPREFAKSGSMSIQAGLLTLGILIKSRGGLLPDNRSPFTSAIEIDEIVEWSNGLIVDSKLQPVLDLIQPSNLPGLLDEVEKYCWPFFWAIEICPSEFFPDELKLPIIGIFDEFDPDFGPLGDRSP